MALEDFYSKKDQSSRNEEQELLKHAWRHERFVEDGVIFDVVGVAHDPEATRLYGAKLTELIKNAEVLLVEGGPQAKDRKSTFEDTALASPEALQEFKEILVLIKERGLLPENIDFDSVSDNELTRVLKLYFDNEQEFFSKIEAVAATYDVPIAYADPLNSIRAYGKDHDANPEAVLQESVKTASFLTGAAALTTLTLIKTSESRMTRRQFITGSFLSIATAILSAGGLGAVRLSEIQSRLDFEIQQNSGSKEGLDRFIDETGRAGGQYGMFAHNAVNDYREVIGGLATKKLGDQFGRVTVVWGANHFQSLSHYTKNTHEAELRATALYHDRLEYDPPTVTVYTHTGKLGSGDWNEVSTKALLD